MIQLEGCISFWEEKLRNTGYLLDPSSEVLIKETIKYLRELQKVKGTEHGT